MILLSPGSSDWVEGECIINSNNDIVSMRGLIKCMGSAVMVSTQSEAAWHGLIFGLSQAYTFSLSPVVYSSA